MRVAGEPPRTAPLGRPSPTELREGDVARGAAERLGVPTLLRLGVPTLWLGELLRLTELREELEEWLPPPRLTDEEWLLPPPRLTEEEE